ncbi:MAG: DUF4489 domain-containing protein [Clostridium sp.]|nr:DUF4489 domain-containing protein [Clostridium sp.]
MNSLTNSNYENTSCHHPHCFDPCPPRYVECKEHADLHPLPGHALLEIGTGFNPTISATTTLPASVAQVIIDPTCFCEANIKIEFSSILQLTGLTAADNLTVQLSRIIYSHGVAVPEVLQSFPITIGALVTGSLPFGFVFGDKSASSRRRTYLVSVVSRTLTGAGTVAFGNVNILALAVGGIRKF